MEEVLQGGRGARSEHKLSHAESMAFLYCQTQTLIKVFPPSTSGLKPFVLGKEPLTRSPNTKGKLGAQRNHVSSEEGIAIFKTVFAT